MTETEEITTLEECRRWLLLNFKELGIRPLPLDSSDESFEYPSSNCELKMSSTTKHQILMLKNELARKKG